MIYLNGQKLDLETFPNGETRINGKQVMEIADRTVMNRITFKYENDSDLVKLMLVKKYLDNRLDKSIQTDLNILYMPYSRMDRSEDGSPFTLKYVADFINSLNFDDIEVTEPHSDVTMALLNRSFATYPTQYLLPYVLERVGFNKDVDYLFFPDAGAAKRYSKLEGFKTAFGHKSRDFSTGKITDFQVVGAKDLSESKVIIVDDLCSYGGTFYGVDKETGVRYGAALELDKLKAKEIYLFIAHAEYSIFKGIIFDDFSPIDKVFCTNSIINEEDVPEELDSRIHVFNII